MCLKRLEIQGFKSFRERIKLELNPGLTVIVGPNGSGKSNIADAISWCLGEQRASILRGSRMEDVIFAGSDVRKPVGMAEVTLTLDNSAKLFSLPYEEISVSRRLYRSGESEYIMNKVPCRLKDIQSLFMDTGLGRGAYSLIGQGRVDEILSSRPEERRAIIEEAAGIVKYRHRKEESVRKLQGATQDLNRVMDIINELAARIEPLSLQAESAMQFNLLQKKLQNLELSLYKRDWDDLTGRLSEIKEQLVQAKDKLDMEKPASQEKLEEARVQLLALEEYIAGARERVFSLDSSIERLQNRLTLIQEQMSSQAEEGQRVEKNLRVAREAEQALHQELEKEQQKLSQVKQHVLSQAGLEEETKLAEMERFVNREQQRVEDLNVELIDQLNIVANYRSSRNQAADRKDQLNQRLNHLQRIAGETEVTTRTLRDTAREAEGKLSAHNQRKQELTLLRGQAEEELKQQGTRLTDLQSKLVSTKEQMISKQSRLKVLEENLNSHSGFVRPVRELLRAQDAPSGICGAVVDLIKVPAGFETAMEAALGGALQNLVTETSVQAKEAIIYLKKHNLGRATFLPLDSLRPTPPREGEKNALGLAGVIGLASNLVEIESRYRPVVDLLLGRLVVIDTLENAIIVAGRTEQRLRLVTLSGELFHPGGSLSGGGAVRNAGGMLHTRRERDHLNSEVQELYRQVQEMTVELADREVVQQQQVKQLKELQHWETALELEIQAAQMNVSKVREDISRAEERNQESQWEVSTILQEIEQWSEAEGKAAGDLLVSEQELDSLQSQLSETQRDLAAAREQKAKLEKSVQERKIQQAERRQEVLGLQKVIQRLQEELLQKNDIIRSSQETLKKVNQRTGELEVQEGQIRQELDRTDRERAKAALELAAEQRKRELVVEEMGQLQEQISQLQEQWLQTGQRVHTLEIQQARVQTELELLIARLEEMGLGHPGEITAKPVSNRKLARADLAVLKGRLEAIGPVNPGAEAEYLEVTERYHFLLGQKNDLEESQSSLEQLIGELNRLMASQFEQAFKVINKNFNLVFQQLFGGGEAVMSLTDGDALACGIEITARPPGKKLQNLSLLSGGERALTAIALLFAILQCKPSPFCVLDEIEASLDEANVKRFADYLARTSDEVQFIVISHRKGTMEQAHSLYGVTMEETGVTRLLSMSLEDKQGTKRLA